MAKRGRCGQRCKNIHTLAAAARKVRRKAQNRAFACWQKARPRGAAPNGPRRLFARRLGPVVLFVFYLDFIELSRNCYKGVRRQKTPQTQRPAVACGPQRGKPPRCKGGNSRARQLPNAAISPFGVPFDKILRQTAHSSLNAPRTQFAAKFPCMCRRRRHMSAGGDNFQTILLI